MPEQDFSSKTLIQKVEYLLTIYSGDAKIESNPQMQQTMLGLLDGVRVALESQNNKALKESLNKVALNSKLKYHPDKTLHLDSITKQYYLEIYRNIEEARQELKETSLSISQKAKKVLFDCLPSQNITNKENTDPQLAQAPKDEGTDLSHEAANAVQVFIELLAERNFPGVDDLHNKIISLLGGEDNDSDCWKKIYKEINKLQVPDGFKGCTQKDLDASKLFIKQPIKEYLQSLKVEQQQHQGSSSLYSGVSTRYSEEKDLSSKSKPK